MKGYIYIMYRGADPGLGWHLTDPIFNPRPTLGACMPNIRRLVKPGDQVFAISGRAGGVQQYIVGGFAVDQKISALAAYERFPELRQVRMADGALSGNIIVTPDGSQNPIDYHDNFEKRIENYIVGRDPLFLETQKEIALARSQSLAILREVLKRPNAKTVSEAVARWRKLDASQIEELRSALDEIKQSARDARH